MKSVKISLEMAQKVKEDYRKLTPDITYLYSDGTKVFDE